MRKIKRAILSVYDKAGIVDFAYKLKEMNVEILSTGGTAKLLQKNNISVTLISEYTQYPEILDGRVKTLNPIIHGGILGKTTVEKHRFEMEKNNIKPIDMVVVNLYPFEATISKKGVTFDDAMENIDIGGPTMLRSAAKNCGEVAVIVDPSDYEYVINEMEKSDNLINKNILLNFAKKVFIHTAHYDSLIANYFENFINEEKDFFPPFRSINLEKIQDLRYGENPHQLAAFYKESGKGQKGVAGAQQLHGKELSFNNIIDIDAALKIVSDFTTNTAVIIKHTNPCGVASAGTLVESYKKARETDPLSAFGGVIGLNKKVDMETAKEIVSTFIEALIAPDYEESALNLLKTKKNLRILKAVGSVFSDQEYDVKKVSGGVLIQNLDLVDLNDDKLKVVTKRKPTDIEWEGLKFAWKVAKHVKSNAIVYANRNETVGIGAGQMSRVDSSKIAAIKANKPLKGTTMASDAFFPFRDGIDAAAEVGVAGIIQPGGSIRDEEIIAAADEQNLTMVFTGIRHFKH